MSVGAGTSVMRGVSRRALTYAARWPTPRADLRRELTYAASWPTPRA